MNAARRNIGIIPEQLVTHMVAPDEVVVERSRNSTLARYVIPAKDESGRWYPHATRREDGRQHYRGTLVRAKQDRWLNPLEHTLVVVHLRKFFHRGVMKSVQKAHANRCGADSR